MESYINKLKNGGKNVCVYGMGNGAEKIIRYLKANGIEISGVFASDDFVRGQSFLGMRVLTEAQAEALYGDFACVSAFALHGEDCGIFRRMAKRRLFFAPNLPPYGDGCIDEAYIERESAKIAEVRSLFADESSKKLFDSLLRYDVTADIGDLYVDPSVPEGWFGREGAFVDVGAYDGDTAEEYILRSGANGTVYAFEPDAVNYRKLCARMRKYPNARCVNAACGDFDGKTFFEKGKGRGGKTSREGAEISAVKIDTYVKERVGAVKIDAEGADEAVLCGAVNTLYSQSPAVKCAVYHRAYDLTEIPLWLARQMPGSRIYLRNAEYIPAFDVFAYALK